MASVTKITEVALYDTLVNYLVSMSRTVEEAMNRALDALVNVESSRTADLPGEVFLLEPRINEMEIVIDEHAIRLLRRSSFNDDEMRLIVAALKITNDLERIGDLAVNLAECVISLREMPRTSFTSQPLSGRHFSRWASSTAILEPARFILYRRSSISWEISSRLKRRWARCL